MEEMFELLLVVICAVVGIAAKASKNKKKTQTKPASKWEEMGERISVGIEKLNEIIEEEDESDEDDEGDEVPHIAMNPVIIPPVIQGAPAAAPVMPLAPEGVPSGEGDCDHPLHEPVVIPMPKPALKPVKEAAAIEIERIATHRSSVIPGKVNAAQLRQAVVMSEVLGRPVVLKGAVRR